MNVVPPKVVGSQNGIRLACSEWERNSHVGA
jgi:hypothetical protein